MEGLYALRGKCYTPTTTEFEPQGVGCALASEGGEAGDKTAFIDQLESAGLVLQDG